MQTCHYCEKAVGNTDDHIVPRALLPKEYPNALPMRFHQRNRVPACGPCNNTKGSYKSDCECFRCIEAWALARHYLEPLGWWEPPVITVEQIREGRKKHLRAEIRTNAQSIIMQEVLAAQENEVVDLLTEYPNWPYDD